VVLFTTTLGLYGGVLWGGEFQFQGFIIHELVPTDNSTARCYPLHSPVPIGKARSRSKKKEERSDCGLRTATGS
jgi:hypothetical protein